MFRCMIRRGLALCIWLGMLSCATTTRADSPDLGRAFDPQPISEAAYDQIAPVWQGDPDQYEWIVARDGTRLYLEVWLPKQRPGGPAVPKRLPSVLNMTPYEAPGEDGRDYM